MKRLEEKCYVEIESDSDVRIMKLKRFQVHGFGIFLIPWQNSEISRIKTSRYDEPNDLTTHISKMMDFLCKSIEAHKKEFEISKRDITEEKIKMRPS